jgi:hypothetical protein
MPARNILARAILAAVAGRLRFVLASVAKLVAIQPTGVYRPEEHYMRGPGPMWRKKHAPSS